MAYKWPPIDMLKLMSTVNHEKWNEWLTKCLYYNDIEDLKKTRYGLQIGMDNAVKAKLNSDKVVHLYIRLNRSIELTLKKILRKKYPNPLDNPRTKVSEDLKKMALMAKRQRDSEFEKFMRESSW